MLPLVKWPGGKYHKRKIITAILPDHTTYVEPFAGGASIYWNKRPAAVEVLGDITPWLIKFYDDARTGGLDQCEPVAFTRENFARSQRCSSSCCKLMHNKMSFQGDMLGYRNPMAGESQVATSVLRDLPKYKSRLRKTILRESDFAETMQKYDSPATVHYLDPPYTALERTKKYSKQKYTKANGGGGELTVERVADVAKQMQGKVVISYDDSPRARKAFNRAGFYVYRLPINRSLGMKGSVKDHELLVTNFQITSPIKTKK